VSNALNAFIFGHGPMTITLADIYMLTGLKITGPMQPYELLSAGSKRLAKISNCTRWASYILNHIGDDDSAIDDREHVAFLNMWLERFIFCGSSCGPTYNHKYLAECLAAQNEIPLGKYLLGSVYHLIHQVATQLLKGETVHIITGPLWLIPLWLNLYMHRIAKPDLKNLSFPSTNFAEGEEGTTRQCMNYGEAASAISIAVETLQEDLQRI
jgi:hypothetical protein